MTDTPSNDDQQQPVEQWAANEADAIASLNLREEEWRLLKQEDGFPARDKSKGWPVHDIVAWLREETSDLDGTSASDEAENVPAENVDTPDEKQALGTPDALPPENVPPDEPDDVDIIELILPVATPRSGTYIATQMGRVDVRLDRLEELPGFKRLHAGLRAENAEFPSGKPVDTPQDVVRYVMLLVTQQCQAVAMACFLALACFVSGCSDTSCDDARDSQWDTAMQEYERQTDEYDEMMEEWEQVPEMIDAIKQQNERIEHKVDQVLFEFTGLLPPPRIVSQEMPPDQRQHEIHHRQE